MPAVYRPNQRNMTASLFVILCFIFSVSFVADRHDSIQIGKANPNRPFSIDPRGLSETMIRIDRNPGRTSRQYFANRT
jgi:hypothetical protein